MRYALRENYNPVSYYQFRFFERHETAKEFIQVLEFYAMQTAINASADTRVLWSKVDFYEACVTAGIPTPPIIVFLGRGTERWFRTPDQQLPRGSIFIKWIDGQQGIGNERWEYAPQDERWTRKGTSLLHDDMLSYCWRKGNEHSLIVQPAIRNHAEIDRFNASALCTLRVMTYRNEGEKPKLIRACFKIARHGAEVDNLYGGAIASGIDPHSGVMGPRMARCHRKVCTRIIQTTQFRLPEACYRVSPKRSTPPWRRTLHLRYRGALAGTLPSRLTVRWCLKAI